MPQALALLPVILGAVSGGIGLAKTIGGPGGTPPILPQPSAASLAQDAEKTRLLTAQRASIQLPGLQERLGGSANPEYLAQMAGLLSGEGGAGGAGGNAIQDAVNQWLGVSGGSGTPSGLSSPTGTGGSNIFDLFTGQGGQLATV